MLRLIGEIGITRDGRRPAPRLQNMLRLRGRIGITTEAPRLQNMLILLVKIGITREAGTSKHKVGTPLGFLKNSWPKASSQTKKHAEITWQH